MSSSSDVPSSTDEKPTNEMAGHSYDGITECDNPMPSWWVGTFVITVLFAGIYFLHYGVGYGPTLSEELAEAMIEIEKAKPKTPNLEETEESLANAMAPVELLTLGSTAFAGKCAVCHGQSLQGQIGPNLTDPYWIHGKGTRTDIIKVIRKGVGDKGMPPWEQVLSKDEVYGLTAFILSKKGSSPANPKAPQGELVQE